MAVLFHIQWYIEDFIIIIVLYITFVKANDALYIYILAKSNVMSTLGYIIIISKIRIIHNTYIRGQRSNGAQRANVIIMYIIIIIQVCIYMKERNLNLRRDRVVKRNSNFFEFNLNYSPMRSTTIIITLTLLRMRAPPCCACARTRTSGKRPRPTLRIINNYYYSYARHVKIRTSLHRLWNFAMPTRTYTATLAIIQVGRKPGNTGDRLGTQCSKYDQSDRPRERTDTHVHVRLGNTVNYALLWVVWRVMAELKLYNHVSENKRDYIEQDLAEKLSREAPKNSSDGEAGK